MSDRVFIAYSRQDQEFVLKLAANLKGRGAPVWLDQWDIRAGADWNEAIDEALRACAHFLIVLSPAAVQSREVKGELLTALDLHKSIVPVLYRPCPIPRQLRAIQYVDFTGRGPDDEAALALVLDALGVSDPVPRAETAVPLPAAQAPAAKSPVSQGATASKATPAPDSLATSSPIRLELVRVPAGEFLMGSDPAKDSLAQKDEQPQHHLVLPEFHIGKYPITNEQYAVVVKAKGVRAPDHWKHGRIPTGKEHHPVVNVSWDDALAFCDWLSQASGGTVRLPTEAEWEKAARGEEGRIWPWGNEWDATRLNSGVAGLGNTTPVGQYSPGGDSPYGCADMAGNVWEWCSSLYRSYPYDADDGRENPKATDRRVLRGGAFHYVARNVRCAVRLWDLPDYCHWDFGFRVVSSPRNS